MPRHILFISLFSGLFINVQVMFQKCRMICYLLNCSNGCSSLFHQCSTMKCFLCYCGVHIVSFISFNITQFIKFSMNFCQYDDNKCFFMDPVVLALFKSLFHVLSPPVPAAELSKY